MTVKASTAVVSLAAATLAVVVAAVQLWPVAGWMTPNQHNEDFVLSSEAVKDFRDEWKCDEYDEELVELLKRQATGDNSIETKRKVEKLRQLIEKLKCERFDDFG